MGTRQDGGGGGEGRGFFLSAHRCPEVDLVPHHNSETQIPPPRSLVSAMKNPEFTCTVQSELNYLDTPPYCHCEEVDEEEGSISDWSDEDLSLHFPSSVILPSDDEESDPEYRFECIDTTMETLVKSHDGEGPKMVPKRQIQLKKKEGKHTIKEKRDKLQVKDGPAEGGVASRELSTIDITHQHSDLLLRQHSLPASLQRSSSGVDSYRVYRGPVTEASQGFHVGGKSKQQLQKSLSLDETKTKMASCIIKSVLSKKMQAEQNQTSYQQMRPTVLPRILQPVDRQRVTDRGGEDAGGGAFKAPVHVVRNMRSLVRNTYSLPSTTLRVTQQHNKPSSFKVIGQEESPPPTYQQAVGVKDNDRTKRNSQASFSSKSTTGHINSVTTSLTQSQHSNHRNRSSFPIMMRRRGSEPIINRSTVEDVIQPVAVDLPANSPVSNDSSELGQSERAGGATTPPDSVVIQPSSCQPSKCRNPEGTQLLLSAQEKSAVLGVSSQFAPSSCQQILHSCFYTHISAPTLPHHMWKVSYLHGPPRYIQTQVQSIPSAPIFHTHGRSEENQSKLTGNVPERQDHYTPNQTMTTDQRNNGNTATKKQLEQQKRQQQLQQHQHQCLHGSQGFLPAKDGHGLLVDLMGSAAAPGVLYDSTSCNLVDLKNLQCFYVERPPPSEWKILLDPDTGQHVQVFLPASSSTANSMCPVTLTNPTNLTPSAIKPPAVMMQLQPVVTMFSSYAPPFFALPLHTPTSHIQHCDDITV